MKNRADEVNGLAAELFLNSEYGKAVLAQRETEAKRIEAARELRELRTSRAEKIREARTKLTFAEAQLKNAEDAYRQALARRGDCQAELITVQAAIDARIGELRGFLRQNAPEALSAKREALQRDLDRAVSTPRDQYVSGGNAEQNYALKMAEIERIKREIEAVENEILNPKERN